MKQIFFLLTLISITFVVNATPTKLIVRVKAKDAKFIGTGIGGAYIVIKNNLTGEVLAKGLTQGASGSTELLMQSALGRKQVLTDNKTAKFEASIDITEPLLVDVQATAPVAKRGAAINGTTQLWLIPGKNIEGDGLIIELPGFVLDILNPTTHAFIQQAAIKEPLELKVSLTMLCGCTITKGGVWDADSIEVAGYIKKDGIRTKDITLKLSKEANIFTTPLPASEKGTYQVTVYAYDPRTGNTGVDNVNFVIQ
ncbi:MAG: hypothetical protein J0I41_03335 [Filimonas sp.]|nr:hypothetical protein [Filimonas sp.]